MAKSGDMGVLLSVIIPVYNAQNYIGHCLETLLQQNLYEFQYEIICINDGSTDASVDVICKYQTEYKNILLINQSNGGVSKARNVGLAIAKGKFVWFIDADDYVAINSIGNIIAPFADKTIDVISFDFGDVEESASNIIEFKNCEFKIETIESAAQFYDKNKIKNSVCNHIYRMDILKGNTIRFPENVSIGEDLFFNSLVLGHVKRNAVFNEIVYFRRLSVNSLTRVSSQKSRKKHYLSAFNLIGFYADVEKKTSNQTYREFIHNRKVSYCCLATDILLTISEWNFVSQEIERLTPYKVDIVRSGKQKNSKKRKIVNYVARFMPFRIWLWLMWVLHKRLRD